MCIDINDDSIDKAYSKLTEAVDDMVKVMISKIEENFRDEITNKLDLLVDSTTSSYLKKLIDEAVRSEREATSLLMEELGKAKRMLITQHDDIKSIKTKLGIY